MTATHNGQDTTPEHTLFVAFALSEKTWKLGCTTGQGQKPRERPVEQPACEVADPVGVVEPDRPGLRAGADREVRIADLRGHGTGGLPRLHESRGELPGSIDSSAEGPASGKGRSSHHQAPAAAPAAIKLSRARAPSSQRDPLDIDNMVDDDNRRMSQPPCPMTLFDGAVRDHLAPYF